MKQKSLSLREQNILFVFLIRIDDPLLKDFVFIYLLLLSFLNLVSKYLIPESIFTSVWKVLAKHF